MKILYGAVSGLVLSAFVAAPAFAGDLSKPLNISGSTVKSSGTVVNGNTNGKKCNGNNNSKVPEPASMLLLGLGVAGIAAGKRLRKG